MGTDYRLTSRTGPSGRRSPLRRAIVARAVRSSRAEDTSRRLTSVRTAYAWYRVASHGWLWLVGSASCAVVTRAVTGSSPVPEGSPYPPQWAFQVVRLPVAVCTVPLRSCSLLCCQPWPVSVETCRSHKGALIERSMSSGFLRTLSELSIGPGQGRDWGMTRRVIRGAMRTNTHSENRSHRGDSWRTWTYTVSCANGGFLADFGHGDALRHAVSCVWWFVLARCRPMTYGIQRAMVG